MSFAIVQERAGFVVTARGKPIVTPAGGPLALPTRGLAEAIASEWRAAGAKPAPEKLPMTRSAATAIDLIPARRADVIADLLAYAETELVCHRAERPPRLVERQEEAWQPLLDWLAARHGARLMVTRAIQPLTQPPESLAALRRAVEAHDHFRLSGLSLAVTTAGSLVIGLALAAGRLDAAGAYEAAELDAEFQIAQWGDDPLAAARRAAVRADLASAARFLALLDAAA